MSCERRSRPSRSCSPGHRRCTPCRWDEALALPSEEAVRLALRTQQIVAYESGVTRTVDPLGGSYYVESLTDELERRIRDLIDQIEQEGGVVKGIEDGAPGGCDRRRRVPTGTADRVRRAGCRRREPLPRRGGGGAGRRAAHGARGRAGATARAARTRSAAPATPRRVENALEGVRAAAGSSENTMPAILAAVRAYATLGEISAALGDVFGYHRASTAV